MKFRVLGLVVLVTSNLSPVFSMNLLVKEMHVEEIRQYDDSIDSMFIALTRNDTYKLQELLTEDTICKRGIEVWEILATATDQGKSECVKVILEAFSRCGRLAEYLEKDNRVKGLLRDNQTRNVFYNYKEKAQETFRVPGLEYWN